MIGKLKIKPTIASVYLPFSTRQTILIWILIFSALTSYTQAGKSEVEKISFSEQSGFIQNIGQYGKVMKGHEAMGAILYGYEGLNMPVLFTPRGLIHLQRRADKIDHDEEERLEKEGVPEEEIERKRNITNRVITMEWLHTNPQGKIIARKGTVTLIR
jgi:hypothetical protein